MTRRTESTGRVGRSARRALDAIHDTPLNYEATGLELTEDNGWKVDDYCVALPSEPPGKPLTAGAWETARRLMADYEFADPAIVRAVYYPDEPLADRTMLLEARFYGLRFHLGVRVGGLVDETVVVDDQRVRLWGWNYRTLQGHLEMGQMDYEVWKWLDTGTVEFRIHAVSRAATIPNPLVRLGFAVFGRWMQRRFARRALERMDRLVSTTLEGRTFSDSGEDHLLDCARVERDARSE